MAGWSELRVMFSMTSTVTHDRKLTCSTLVPSYDIHTRQTDIAFVSYLRPTRTALVKLKMSVLAVSFAAEYSINKTFFSIRTFRFQDAGYTQAMNRFQIRVLRVLNYRCRCVTAGKARWRDWKTFARMFVGTCRQTQPVTGCFGRLMHSSVARSVTSYDDRRCGRSGASSADARATTTTRLCRSTTPAPKLSSSSTLYRWHNSHLCKMMSDWDAGMSISANLRPKAENTIPPFQFRILNVSLQD